MEQIEKNVATCQRCRLCKFATNAVPGEGNIDSEVVFVGEAPGAEEDKQGRPFVGRAGKLLEQLLREIGYERRDVWIGNIIKHRPPENRDPFPDEVKACQPYLTMQLTAINPKVVVTLGRFAMYYFDKDGKISRDHGVVKKITVSEIGEMAIYPIYHPAAALRNPELMTELRKDFRKIPDIIKLVKANKLEREVFIEDEDQLGLGI